jgi:hypothetical protein
MDVSMSGGIVTDTQGRAAVASMVTVGAVLLAAGRAGHGNAAPESTVPATERRLDRQLIALSFPPRTARHQLTR